MIATTQIKTVCTLNYQHNNTIVVKIKLVSFMNSVIFKWKPKRPTPEARLSLLVACGPAEMLMCFRNKATQIYIYVTVKWYLICC